MQSRHEVVGRLVQRIVQLVHPLRIMLFGSATSGDVSHGSDIDLLVVMPEGVHRRRTAQHLYREIRHVGIPFDVIVATPADLERHRENVGLVYRSILATGKEVYAAR
ncbi:MAG: nucleotidyltransferase domain-containing protein [Planctomycetota bacterium]